ncbi:MAG: hypothetical protein JF606_27115 [Burkholderiales bacterium]|nr:hypothetical protein [Burkholderiales bacterium]
MTMPINSHALAEPVPGAVDEAANDDILDAPLPADHRGWLLFTGGMQPVGSEPVPEWVLNWPCRLPDLTGIIGHLREGEGSQQDLPELNGDDSDAAGPGAASVVVWLVDTFSAAVLGWTAPRSGVTPAVDEHRRSTAELELLFNATMAEVPGTRFELGFDDAAVARRIVATLAKLERAGETHGDTLTRMGLRVLKRRSLPVSGVRGKPREAAS